MSNNLLSDSICHDFLSSKFSRGLAIIGTVQWFLVLASQPGQVSLITLRLRFTHAFSFLYQTILLYSRKITISSNPAVKKLNTTVYNYVGNGKRRNEGEGEALDAG